MTHPHTAWHFVRCSDIETRQRLWVDPSTNCVLSAVELARHGRSASFPGETLSLANPMSGKRAN